MDVLDVGNKLMRFVKSAAVILLVAFVSMWFGYRQGSNQSLSKSAEPTTSEPSVISLSPGASESHDTLFDELVDRIKISYFEADQIPMIELLTKLERQSNEELVSMGWDLRTRISLNNLFEDKVTIVVRNVSLRTLLELISEQTGFQYKVDGQSNEIAFFFNTDIITYGEDDPEDEPGILPPPHLGLPD